ncbi:hypothetical protein D9M68_840230 [compost metagenome]
MAIGRGAGPVVKSSIAGGHVTETSKFFAGVNVPTPVKAELLYEPIGTVTFCTVQDEGPCTTVGPAMTPHVPGFNSPFML